MKNKDIKDCCLTSGMTVRECIEVIDRNKYGIALVVDDGGRLVGTVTDGDIRRFTLANRSLDELVETVMWQKPLSAPAGTADVEIKELMHKKLVRNIPLVDKEDRPVGIVNVADLIGEEEGLHVAVLMVGGEGKRLMPITESIPKPMVHVADRPILETIITSLKEAGISRIYLAINHMGDIIEEYFGDGSSFGVEISYLREDEKLGTVGALSLLPELPATPILVMNGDVVTKTKLMRLLDYHKSHRCVMTVAATRYSFEIPLGVLDVKGHYLLGLSEKPQQHFLCNAGIYVINPEVVSLIPNGLEFNTTDLISELVRKGLPVTTFPIHEYWVDVGQVDDLKRARKDMASASSLDEIEEN
ncbi:D-glycero-D-manno-heptose 1-phosphate guanosyltransferase [hydrothermal vent metagenome]|uniref:D-glycero-D-manno-heptose 1-phosphate guanosyltransferase n=1 Tax=hydrothermal vent metagenome TaxID=652676 RepID=A0A3B0QU06_9ZZZZ